MGRQKGSCDRVVSVAAPRYQEIHRGASEVKQTYRGKVCMWDSWSVIRRRQRGASPPGEGHTRVSREGNHGSFFLLQTFKKDNGKRERREKKTDNYIHVDKHSVQTKVQVRQ